MASPTNTLPFEYTQRWAEVGPLLVPDVDGQTVNLLNKRDKDLEDYLAGLGTGGACPCYSAYIIGNNTSLSITAGTTDNSGITWDAVALVDGNPVSNGTWSINGSGEIVPPTGAATPGTPDQLYMCTILADFAPGTGSDPVLCELYVNTHVTAWAVQGYNAPGLGCALNLTLHSVLPFNGAGVSMTAASASTRAVDVAIEGMFWSMCGCTGPVPGGG